METEPEATGERPQAATTPAVAKRWTNSRRFRPVLLLCVGLMIIFGLQRVGLAVASQRLLADVSGRQMLVLFANGFREDLRALAWLILPLAPLLSLTPNRAFASKWLRSTLASYVAGVLVLALTVCTADALFFLKKHARLNWQVPNYLGEGEIVVHLWKNYPIILIGLGAVLTMVGAFHLARRYCLSGPEPSGPRWARLTYGAVLLGVVLLSAHRPAERPSGSSSQAYFCSNNMASELAFNPFITGSGAVKDYITEGEDEPERYNLLDEVEAFMAARAALQQDHTVFHGGAANPLWRTVHTGRPRRDVNVVLIVMESFAGPHVGALGHEGSQTPFFDSLADKSIFFSRMYASGSRTSRGLTAILCGFPGLGGKSILARSRAMGKFPSLFGVMAERGYRTSFIYGGDGNFDNMNGFFSAAGLQQMIDIRHMPADTWRTDWGIADHEMFAHAHEHFQAAGDRPFFSVLLTVTNHHPYKVPPGCIEPAAGGDEDALLAHTTRYADWALQQFFTMASSGDYFHNTVFVLLADHGPKFNPRRLVDVEGYRIPCAFYAPGLTDLKPRRIETPCSQTDVWPTLLSLLGGDFSHAAFGRDLLAVRPTDRGLALLRKDRCMALVRGDLMFVELPDSDPMLFRQGTHGRLEQLDPSADPFDEAADMHRTAMGLYQSARALYLRQSYGTKPKR